MVTFIALHCMGGLLIGARYRFAALLPAFAFVLVEAAVATIHPLFAPWYVILGVGLAAVQAGYLAAAIVRPFRRPEQPPAPARPYVSVQE